MWGVSYWVFPVISALCWLGMLLGLLIHWLVKPSNGDGAHYHYPSESRNQHIAYISDVGAFELKPLFIAGSCVTTIFLDLSFASERWLRHRGRLAPNTSTFEKVLSALSIVFAICGTAGLILLSIFDTYHHPRIHDGCLLLFIAGYVISAIFICIEYQRLGVKYREHRVLRASFWIKLAFIFVELVLAIVFASTFSNDNHQDLAAIFEWAVAFVFTGYVLSFLIDLAPAAGTHGARKSDQTQMEMEVEDTELRSGRGSESGLRGDTRNNKKSGRTFHF